MYDTDEIWAMFEHKSGSKQWPSDDPKDSPIDDFTCKKCGKVFALQMYGGRSMLRPSFEKYAYTVLEKHIYAKHAEHNRVTQLISRIEALEERL